MTKRQREHRTDTTREVIDPNMGRATQAHGRKKVRSSQDSQVALSTALELHQACIDKSPMTAEALVKIKAAIQSRDKNLLANALVGLDPNNWGTLTLKHGRKHYNSWVSFADEADDGWNRWAIPTLMAFSAHIAPVADANVEQQTVLDEKPITTAVNIEPVAETPTPVVITETYETKVQNFVAASQAIEKNLEHYLRLLMRKEHVSEVLWEHVRFFREDAHKRNMFYKDFFYAYCSTMVSAYETATTARKAAEQKVTLYLTTLATALNRGPIHPVVFDKYKTNMIKPKTPYLGTENHEHRRLIWQALSNYANCCENISICQNGLEADLNKYMAAKQAKDVAATTMQVIPSVHAQLQDLEESVNKDLFREVYHARRYTDEQHAAAAPTTSTAVSADVEKAVADILGSFAWSSTPQFQAHTNKQPVAGSSSAHVAQQPQYYKQAYTPKW